MTPRLILLLLHDLLQYIQDILFQIYTNYHQKRIRSKIVKYDTISTDL